MNLEFPSSSQTEAPEGGRGKSGSPTPQSGFMEKSPDLRSGKLGSQAWALSPNFWVTPGQELVWGRCPYPQGPVPVSGRLLHAGAGDVAQAAAEKTM